MSRLEWVLVHPSCFFLVLTAQQSGQSRQTSDSWDGVGDGGSTRHVYHQQARPPVCSWTLVSVSLICFLALRTKVKPKLLKFAATLSYHLLVALLNHTILWKLTASYFGLKCRCIFSWICLPICKWWPPMSTQTLSGWDRMTSALRGVDSLLENEVVIWDSWLGGGSVPRTWWYLVTQSQRRKWDVIRCKSVEHLGSTIYLDHLDLGSKVPKHCHISSYHHPFTLPGAFLLELETKVSKDYAKFHLRHY